MGDLQIRSVDEGLARRAKARAAQNHRSLSDYLKHLIEQDLAASAARDTMQGILAEIQRDDILAVSRSATASALAQARQDMGLE